MVTILIINIQLRLIVFSKIRLTVFSGGFSRVEVTLFHGQSLAPHKLTVRSVGRSSEPLTGFGLSTVDEMIDPVILAEKITFKHNYM